MGLYLYSATGNMLLAILGSMIFCSCLGILIERYVYFPLLKYPPYVPLISSIALLIAIEELCRLVAGPEVRTFPANLPFPTLVISGITISSTLIAVYCISAAVLLLLWLLMTKTELGLAMRAVSQDMETASALGVNTQRTVALTFVIGSPETAHNNHFGRHIDKETGVAPWFKTFEVKYEFVYAGTGKKGGY